MIIDGFLTTAGIDPLQYRALLRASFFLLKRNPASVKGLKTGGSSRTAGIAAMLFIYTILGILFAFVPWGKDDPSIAASIVLIPTSFFIA
jgi:hypothetical protein